MSALSNWCVLYGADGLEFHCQAEDREHAVEQCQDAYPVDLVHVAVPCDAAGTMVLETLTDDPTSCPKCGARTEFGELPFRGWQIHVCSCCSHSFIAVPDEDEDQEAT